MEEKNSKKSVLKVVLYVVLVVLLVVLSRMIYWYKVKAPTLLKSVQLSPEAQERSIFNEQWTKYQLKQPGYDVKQMIDEIIVNYNNNYNNEQKLFDILFVVSKEDYNNPTIINISSSNEPNQNIIEKLNNAKEKIKDDDLYWVDIHDNSKTRYADSVGIFYGYMPMGASALNEDVDDENPLTTYDTNAFSFIGTEHLEDIFLLKND